MFDPAKPIQRSRRDATLGGVCAGVAEWTGWHPSVIRVLYILLTAFTGFLLGIVAYAILWVYLPVGAEPAAAGQAQQPATSGPPGTSRAA